MGAPKVTAVAAFSNMSDEDQVLHLVYDHGFDAGYGYEGAHGHPAPTTNEEVVAMFHRWGRERVSYHRDDHRDYRHGPDNDHTHDRPKGA